MNFLPRFSVLSLGAASLFMTSCGTVPSMEPAEVYRSRATLRQKGGLIVRSTPLSDLEQVTVLERRSPRKAIQPLWVEVENGTPHPLAFLPVGISRDYIPPDEVAYRDHPLGGSHVDPKIDAWHQANAMPGVIPPGQRRSGLVYAPAAPGAVAWNIELLGGGELHRFAFASEIPGFRANFDLKKLEARSAAQGKNLNWAGLCTKLETMQACTTGKGGLKPGDPLNVVLVGKLETLLEVGIRNGWKLAEPITLGSSLREASAVILGGGFPTGPVSPMYVENRQEDLALQRPRPSAKRRNHMRLWLTDWRIDGQPVWVGQISRDIGVRFTRHTWNLTTHRVAADVDESRDNLVAESISTQSAKALGWTKGVGMAPRDQPRHNLTGDPYYTDGLRAVVFLSSESVPTNKIRQLPGEAHALHEAVGGF
ncbi:MAG TPA: LssY C-terminal domain-containing protein [Verrucomicrobium sp.]|nr:LssY C-terminal domain-containing protein [Verrucomicrobium sp.]